LSDSGIWLEHESYILLPPRIVDLKVTNHTPGFWLLVERTMPDFGERRDWLARHGGRLVVS
jgi:hypothetical protein